MPVLDEASDASAADLVDAQLSAALPLPAPIPLRLEAHLLLGGDREGRRDLAAYRDARIPRAAEESPHALGQHVAADQPGSRGRMLVDDGVGEQRNDGRHVRV